MYTIRSALPSPLKSPVTQSIEAGREEVGDIVICTVAVAQCRVGLANRGVVQQCAGDAITGEVVEAIVGGGGAIVNT